MRLTRESADVTIDFTALMTLQAKTMCAAQIRVNQKEISEGTPYHICQNIPSKNQSIPRSWRSKSN